MGHPWSSNATGRHSTLTRWHLSHRLWIEGPEWVARLPWAARMMTLALAIYLMGFALAAAGGVLGAYLQSPAFALGAAGCGFVVASITQRARRIDRLYYELVDTFMVPRDMFLVDIGRRIRRACDPRRHAIASSAVLLAFLPASIFATYLDDFPAMQPFKGSLRPLGFAPELYVDDARGGALFVISFFAVLISVCLGTSVSLVLSELTILRSLRSLPVPPLPEAVRMRLRSLADFHLHISRDWTLGFVAFVVLFFSGLDALSIVLLTVIAVIALGLFLVPQFFLRDVVLRAHRRATEIALASWAGSGKPSARELASELATLAEISARPRYWVYDSGEVVYWLLAQAVAVTALVSQIVVND